MNYNEWIKLQKESHPYWHGFTLDHSGGGCMWLVKHDSRGYWAITTVGGDDAPDTDTEPILIGRYDKAGEEIFPAFIFHSGLKIFMENFKPVEGEPK